MLKQRFTAPLGENLVFLDLTSLLCHGYILSLFTINFLFFKYALPLLGVCLMFYGCHLLHTQNKYFKRAYIISFLRLLLMLANFLVEWTIFYNNKWMILFQLLNSFLLVTLLFLSLNSGFLCLYKEAGIKKYPHGFLKYLFFYWGTLLATLIVHETGVFGALLAIIILLLNIIFIVSAFRQVGKTLANTELELLLTHFPHCFYKKLSILAISYLLVLTSIIFLSNKGALFEANYTVIDGTATATTTDLQEKLQLLGMNKEVISILSKYPNELNEYQNAQTIYQNEDVYHINGGKLRLTIYNVKRLSDYRLVIYYHWDDEPQNRLYHIIECQSNSFQNVGNLHSSSYYDDKLLSTSFQLVPVDLGINQSNYPYTYQKIPNDGSNLRGFFSFTYSLHEVTNETTPITILLNYYYQTSILNLPHINILDYMNHYEQYRSNLVYNRLSIPFTQTNK